MKPIDFAISPSAFGLPDRQQLIDLRIWDAHYHGFNDHGNVTPAELLRIHEETYFYSVRMGIERIIALDIGGQRGGAFMASPIAAEQRELLTRQSDRISGIIRIDPSDPEKSCEKMKEWIENGPCIGIKYAYFNRSGIRCSHPNSDPIVRYARELGAVVYVCSWRIVGGNPRHAGGGNRPAESLPTDVVELAKRFPDVPIICGHSGGDWELAIGSVRSQRNVYFEFAGTDPHSGAVDAAVRELGADRITWGGHGPSRSLSTELSKVLDADLSPADRMKVLGGNFRRILSPIFARKGMPMP